MTLPDPHKGYWTCAMVSVFVDSDHEQNPIEGASALSGPTERGAADTELPSQPLPFPESQNGWIEASGIGLQKGRAPTTDSELKGRLDGAIKATDQRERSLRRQS